MEGFVSADSTSWEWNFLSVVVKSQLYIYWRKSTYKWTYKVEKPILFKGNSKCSCFFAWVRDWFGTFQRYQNPQMLKSHSQPFISMDSTHLRLYFDVGNSKFLGIYMGEWFIMNKDNTHFQLGNMVKAWWCYWVGSCFCMSQEEKSDMAYGLLIFQVGWGLCVYHLGKWNTCEVIDL